MAKDEMAPALLDEDYSPQPASAGEEAPVKPPQITAEDIIAAQAQADAAFAAMRGEPTVRVRVPKVMGPQVVIINGARFNVPCNVPVDLPQSVADVLMEAERI